ncbi:sugar ABC transporter permease [Actinomadura darangshiensis]|uniref:Sugar ABC transporter permease n=1 Tax=Actinomadura darangshiensis TaxID=705336 RepID=A0A4R5ANK9_9ACTN|nr:sugar ABC transporter permease [Actinomadura darangshiensis]TDD74233.1 sugar ABC transporter permease [Actinomadura darangshiensis]
MAPAPLPGARREPGGALRIVLGLVLLGPAALFMVISLVVPTVQTILRSFERAGPARAAGGGPLPEGEFVGVDNYLDLFGNDEFWKALAFTLSLAVIPLVVAVVVAPLLAGALDRAGTWPRRVGRVLMSVPLVVFSPVAFSVAWLMGMRDGGLETTFGELTDPGSARVAVVAISGLTTFGAVCGLALLGYLAVLRGRGPGRRVLPALAVGTIAALATFAVSLQAFSSVYTMTRGGPGRSTQTLSLLQFSRAFMLFDFGHGAAIATVTGLILGVLGIAATLIAIIAALRIDLTPPDRAATAPDDPAGPVKRPGGPLRTLVAVVALLAVLAVVLIGAWPWLSALFSSPDPRASASTVDARTYVNTWVPPLLGALVSVGVAFTAALGVGGLRPMGRRSEWLLLPFAPWLFVGIGPLSVIGFENARSLDLINTFAGLVPPTLISVPALVVLTLFCRGRAPVWQAQVAAGAPAAAGFLRVVVVPALPLATLLGGAVVLINAQGLLWPLLVGSDRDNATAPVVLVNELNQFSRLGVSLGFVTPLAVVIVALLALVALQITYLDRLAITIDRPVTASAPGVSTPHPGAEPMTPPVQAPPPGPAPQPKPEHPPG